MLFISEIFQSLQGESSWAGRRCVFIRLSECNLRCNFCDTKFAYKKGKALFISEILKKVKKYRCRLVEITGGEPLLQKQTPKLIDELIKNKYRVLIETNGSFSLKNINPKAIKIVDFKCPSSGMSKKMNWQNISSLSPQDELKFVIQNKKDFNWAEKIIEKYQLEGKHKIHFSPAWKRLSPQKLGHWILKDNLNGVGLHLQQHKIWRVK